MLKYNKTSRRSQRGRTSRRSQRGRTSRHIRGRGCNSRRRRGGGGYSGFPTGYSTPRSMQRHQPPFQLPSNL